MSKQSLGILHPGQMGISIAASAKNSGYEVSWASDGRSAETRARAEEHGLSDAGTLALLCQRCPIIICVCPPAAAETVAQDVLANGFRGLYIDANAISPERAHRIGTAMAKAGATFVDGGIIGGPAWKPKSTWLHLSGRDATAAAAYFAAGPLETNIVGDEIGQASALKMCFAAYTKGSTALLCAVMGSAEALGVGDALTEQWSQKGSTFAEESERRVRGVTAKAWRFEGEMYEIAATFEEAGLPGGFHEAAADVYARIAGFKGADELPMLDQVLESLTNEKVDTTD